MKNEEVNQAKETEYRIFRSLQSLFDRISALSKNKDQTNAGKINLLIAFSGGCDSVCLLHSIAKFRDPRKGSVTAVHVHHGISSNADAWAHFTEQVAKECGIHYVLRKIKVGKTGLGLEAEARRLRYLALSEVAQEIHANTILTAHHRDDQLETFLIQWMRGAGIEGLAGMPFISDDPIPISRPFLDLGRVDLEEYAISNKWQWVNDESNSDTSYLRNLIRLQILPVLDAARPGYRKAAARSIQLLAESSEILKLSDEKDFQNICGSIGNKTSLKVPVFLEVSAPKRSRLLRHWLRSQGISQVPKHRIDFILQQLEALGKTKFARLIKFGDKELLLKSDQLCIGKTSHVDHGYDVIFHWKGERAVEIPEFNGILLFEERESGFPADWLMEKPLSISLRKGKDRIKVKTDSPPKLIKVLCQEAGLDPATRERLPIVRRNGQIIYAASLGSELRATFTTKARADKDQKANDVNAGERKLISIKWLENEEPTS
ncbi:MAG: tRNA lysidine(34) synthetase TilS [Burkholderiales bacterium]|nr:tRNA lysidine(34) synthetase TilS [Burkholderiales bacterium]